jgi:hypothetical protein
MKKHELKQLIKETILAELQPISNDSFEALLKRIPNEKYFYIIDENADLDLDDSDLVDYFYDPIFNNELKGKPGVLGDDYQEFQEMDRIENPTKKGTGKNEMLLVNKIKQIISDYKK